MKNDIPPFGYLLAILPTPSRIARIVSHLRSIKRHVPPTFTADWKILDEAADLLLTLDACEHEWEQVWLVAAEAARDALSRAGIVDDHGTLRWVFTPGQLEVSSSGADPLFHLLQEVRYLIDDLHRQRDTEREAAARLRAACQQLMEHWREQADAELKDTQSTRSASTFAYCAAELDAAVLAGDAGPQLIDVSLRALLTDAGAVLAYVDDAAGACPECHDRPHREGCRLIAVLNKITEVVAGSVPPPPAEEPAT